MRIMGACSSTEKTKAKDRKRGNKYCRATFLQTHNNTRKTTNCKKQRDGQRGLALAQERQFSFAKSSSLMGNGGLLWQRVE